jgi:pimeloyl-ACP methyl ester carboxylesterase
VLVEPSFPVLMKGTPKETDYVSDRALWMEQMRVTLRDGFPNLALAHLVEWTYGPNAIETFPRLIGQRMADDAGALKLQYLSTVTDPTFGPEQIKGITCPVLYVEGEKSPWRTHAMADAFIAARPETQRATLKGATHGMIWADPKDFSRTCLEFIGHDKVAEE